MLDVHDSDRDGYAPVNTARTFRWDERLRALDVRKQEQDRKRAEQINQANQQHAAKVRVPRGWDVVQTSVED